MLVTPFDLLMSIAYSGEIIFLKEFSNLNRRMITSTHHVFFLYGDMARCFGYRNHRGLCDYIPCDTLDASLFHVSYNLISTARGNPYPILNFALSLGEGSIWESSVAGGATMLQNWS
jgi:hypothetical protein